MDRANAITGKKIRYCDLLHRFMFHDKNSCRKLTFLSFIVGEVIIVCITFGSWMMAGSIKNK